MSFPLAQSINDTRVTVLKPSGHGVVLLILTVIFMALSTTTVTLRLISKWLKRSRSAVDGNWLTADDYLMLLALVWKPHNLA